MAGLYGNDADKPVGLLGMFTDPRMMGLLGMAQGFAEAGAPSPYRVSTGQALSRGLMGGAKAAQGVMQVNAMNQFRQAQMRKLQAEAEKQEEDKRLRQSILGQMGLGQGGLFGQGSGMDFDGVTGNPSQPPQGLLAMSPERLDAMATYLALTGHPGSAALTTAADRLRTKNQEREAVESFKSKPGTLGAGVTTNSPQGQAILSGMTGDSEFDAAALQAQNEALNSNTRLPSQPIQAPQPGLFGPLLASQHVGPFAQNLQGQLDRASAGMNPQQWMSHYDRLVGQHQTATNAASARAEQGDLRRELAGQADTTRRELAGQADETRRLLGQMSRQGREDRQGDLTAQREFTRERSLANDFNSLSKDFRTVLPSFQASARYVAGGKYNSSGDRDLAFSFARTMDPKDRVGVHDIRDINKLGNLPERMKQAIVALAEGKELPERVRLEMFQAMRNRFDSMNELQQQIEDEYEGRARQYMLAPDRVVQRFAVRETRPSARPNSGATGGWSAREKK